jgi:hypothetical protein
MPNYCSNNVTMLNGEDILPYIEQYLIQTGDPDGETNLDFAKIVPKNDSEEYTDEWNVENWGTKWGCMDGFVQDTGGIYFNTAWSPACPIIQKLSELIGESLRLTYLEEGMGFCGEYIANPDGTYSDKEYDDLENVPDSLKEELGLNEREEYEEEEDRCGNMGLNVER